MATTRLVVTVIGTAFLASSAWGAPPRRLAVERARAKFGSAVRVTKRPVFYDRTRGLRLYQVAVGSRTFDHAVAVSTGKRGASHVLGVYDILRMDKNHTNVAFPNTNLQERSLQSRIRSRHQNRISLREAARQLGGSLAVNARHRGHEAMKTRSFTMADGVMVVFDSKSPVRVQHAGNAFLEGSASTKTKSMFVFHPSAGAAGGSRINFSSSSGGSELYIRFNGTMGYDAVKKPERMPRQPGRSGVRRGGAGGISTPRTNVRPPRGIREIRRLFGIR